jgi:hypothetical protein
MEYSIISRYCERGGEEQRELQITRKREREEEEEEEEEGVVRTSKSFRVSTLERAAMVAGGSQEERTSCAAVSTPDCAAFRPSGRSL